jgi:hypothetical protein
MSSYGDELYAQPCVIEAPGGVAESGAQLEDYIADSTQRVESVEERLAQGESIDDGSRQWMLDQVDHIVETVGSESVEMSDEMRSNMLQLLLAIANLNEQIRHDSSAAH